MKKNSYSELMKILIIIVIGSLLSLWLFQYMNGKSQSEREEQFFSSAKEHIYLIDKNIKKELALLKSIVALFEASDNVTRKEFSLFVKTLSDVGERTSFQALEWIPHVSLAERNRFRALARKEGLVEFTIKEKNKEQRLIKAKKRQSYYPVYYVEPYKGNELALGFDLASNPVRKKALENSRDSGKVIASGKVDLVQLKNDRTGILTFYPIYAKNKQLDSIEQRRKSLIGFALGVMKVKSLVLNTSTNQNMNSLNIDYYFFDLDESEQDALYIHYAKEKKAPIPKLSLKDIRNGFHFEREIKLGDRRWNIIARPNKSNFSSKLSSQNVAMFLFSMLVVILLSAYIFIHLKRVRSIAERNLVEQALVLSEARLNEAQRIAKVGSWELDLLNNELNWSDEIFQMFELDKSTFNASYEAFLNAIHPEDRDRVNQAYTDSLASRKPYEIVHRLKMNDGKIKHVREICETFYDADKALRSVGTVQDISQLYKTEQDLKTAMALNEQVIDASPIGISIYDETGQCLSANKATANVVGATHEQVLAQNYHKIKSWKTSGLYKIAVAAVESGERHRGEHEVVTTFGKHAVYDCMFVPFNQHGKQHLLLMIDDITERKHAESELSEYREHLEERVEERTKELRNTQDELVRKERLATLGQLTATVSHELRNPLGAMRPSLYVIEKKSDKEDEQIQNAIERIDRNIERCDRTIDELLDFTRITELNREPTRVDEWLESVIDEQLLPDEIYLKKEFSVKDIELTMDRDRLRRAIINVFENACHAMMENNKKIVNIESAILGVKTAVNDERIEISISDTGSGIADNVLDNIYEPLFSTKGFGVGLGMPTVKQIMQQHSGGIDIKTEKGKGTSVILWLPLNTHLQEIKTG